MAKKGLKNNKSSSQKEEETSEMSNTCEVDLAREPHRLGSVLRQIVDQIDDAERSNTDTLQEMQTRLSMLSKKTLDAKARDNSIDQDALNKIENQIAGLSSRIEIISQGRAINADNLETRIEALATGISEPKAEAPGIKDSQTAQSSSATSAKPEATKKVKAAEADITFAVTDQMGEEDDFSTSPVNFDPVPDIDSEQEAMLYSESFPYDTQEEKSNDRSDGETGEKSKEAFSTEHKIRAKSYDAGGHIAPQKLASLAEHFSPVFKGGQEQSEDVQQPVEKSEPEQPREAVSSDLESRFALIASRLEETLACRERDLEEREEITHKFDELALKFETWLNSNDQKKSINGIEQRIDALAEYVRKAEAHAARIDVIESQLVKLIDLVEKNKTQDLLQKDLSEAFEDIASRILAEKSVMIADLVATRVGERLENRYGDDRLIEIQRSISAISADRRVSNLDTVSGISSVKETLQSMSGRLSSIEEHIRMGLEASQTEIKKNLEPLQLPEPDTSEESEPVDSFHDELELSMNEVLEHKSDLDFVEKEPGLSLRSKQGPDIPLVLSKEPVFRDPLDLKDYAQTDSNVREGDNEYVAAARRAAKAAFEKNKHSHRNPDRERQEDGMLGSLREQRNRIAEKSMDIGSRFFSFKKPTSKSFIIFGAAGLMLVCLGILYKELSSTDSLPVKTAFREELKKPRPAVRGTHAFENERIEGSSRENSVVSGNAGYRTLSKGDNSGNAKDTEKEILTASGKEESRPLSSGDDVKSEAKLPSDSSLKRTDETILKADKERESKDLTEPLQIKSSQNDTKAPVDNRDAAAGFVVDTGGGQDISGVQKTETNVSSEASQYNLLSNVPVSGQMTQDEQGQSGLSGKQQAQYIKQVKPDDAEEGLESEESYPVHLPPEQVGSVPLRTAAASGNERAQYTVAKVYLEGKIVERNYPAAVRWLTRSASKSFAPAQYHLGVLYERGEGVDRDTGKAKAWYLRAANRGNIKAMHNLAVLYTQKTDTVPNYREAILWFKRAAGYGFSDSQFNLGVLYKSGLGIKQDKSEAYKWFSLASSRGDQYAQKELVALKSSMTGEEIFIAESELAQWSQNTPSQGANLTDNELISFTGKMLPALADRNIYEAQLLLAKLGYDVGPADGQFGPKTRDAVKSFQLLNGMEANGEITPQLIQLLNGQKS